MAGVPLIPSSLRTDPEGDEDVGSWWVSFTVCHAIVTTNSVLLTLFSLWFVMTVLLNCSEVVISTCFSLGLFPFLGLLAGGALLAGCGQVQLVFRGNPARFVLVVI